MVMMVVGADDDNGLTIVTVVLYVDVVRPSSCTNGKIKTGFSMPRLGWSGQTGETDRLRRTTDSR
jgi:hypothetical protein